jgi:phage/plasmid-like protein (TIGR03299 family)
MAHAIDQSTGKAAVFVTGQPAWHKLGVVIEKAATSALAIKLAGLNWTVEQWPVRAFNPDKPAEEAACTERVANVRTDTKKVLGVVSRGYKVFQNADAFDFMDSLVGDKLAMYETAGALHDGRRIWMLARMPKEYRAAKADLVKPYVLLTTGHDGKSPVQMLATTVRVVCQNTLNLAMKAGAALTVSHFTNLDQRVSEARQKLGIIAARFDQFDAEMHAMIKRPLKSAQADKYFRAQFGVDAGASDLAKKLAERKLDQVRANFDNERNALPGIKGTAWAAYNAVSEYADHQKSWIGKTAKDKADTQLNSIWFGGSHQLKQKAYADALALTKA